MQDFQCWYLSAWTSRVIIYLDNPYLNVCKWIQFLEVVNISNTRGFLKQTNESSLAKPAHPDLKQHNGSLIWVTSSEQVTKIICS